MKTKFINAYSVKTDINLLNSNIKGSYSTLEKEFYLTQNSHENNLFLNFNPI